MPELPARIESVPEEFSSISSAIKVIEPAAISSSPASLEAMDVFELTVMSLSAASWRVMSVPVRSSSAVVVRVPEVTILIFPVFAWMTPTRRSPVWLI